MLTSKGTAFVLGVIAAAAGWDIIESFGHKNWLGLTVSGACLIIVTKIKTRPKIIQAETERIAVEAQILAAVTITKHSLVGQLNAAEVHLRLRGEILRAHAIGFLPYQPRDIRLLTMDEDRNRAKIAGLDYQDFNPDELALPPM